MLLLIVFDQFIVSARSQRGLGPLFRVQIYYKINLITLLYVTQSLLLDNNPQNVTYRKILVTPRKEIRL